MRTNNKHKVITSSCNETPSVSSTKSHNSSAVTTFKGDEEKILGLNRYVIRRQSVLNENVNYKKKFKCPRTNYKILIVIQVNFTICNLSSFI